MYITSINLYFNLKKYSDDYNVDIVLSCSGITCHKMYIFRWEEELFNNSLIKIRKYFIFYLKFSNIFQKKKKNEFFIEWFTRLE